jgi:hypothetical protein
MLIGLFTPVILPLLSGVVRQFLPESTLASWNEISALFVKINRALLVLGSLIIFFSGLRCAPAAPNRDHLQNLGLWLPGRKQPHPIYREFICGLVPGAGIRIGTPANTARATTILISGTGGI